MTNQGPRPPAIVNIIKGWQLHISTHVSSCALHNSAQLTWITGGAKPRPVPRSAPDGVSPMMTRAAKPAPPMPGTVAQPICKRQLKCGHQWTETAAKSEHNGSKIAPRPTMRLQLHRSSLCRQQHTCIALLVVETDTSAHSEPL